jgi:hypothetical protein
MTARVPMPSVQELLPEDLIELWEERAALMEYEGGLAREEAEWQAFLCVTRSSRSHPGGAHSRDQVRCEGALGLVCGSRNVWRTTKGVAQWHGNSEARRRTVTAVSGAMAVSRRTTWGRACGRPCLLRRTLNARPSVRLRPRTGTRHRQPLTLLTSR